MGPGGPRRVASAKRDSEQLGLPLAGAAWTKVLRPEIAACALSVVLKCKHAPGSPGRFTEAQPAGPPHLGPPHTEGQEGLSV